VDAETVGDDKSDLIATVSGGSSSSGPETASQQVMVNELLLKLERTNPTAAPATSPLLNGEWDLVYQGGYAEGLVQSPTRQVALFVYAGGYAPTLFGLTLARLLPDSLLAAKSKGLTIKRLQPRVEAVAEVTFAGTAKGDVVVEATLEAESDVRLKETYTAVRALGQLSVSVPAALAYSRLLFVTYLDDDLLVVRDATGVPEVLVRKPNAFRDDEGQPSAADDDLAPGAG